MVLEIENFNATYASLQLKLTGILPILEISRNIYIEGDVHAEKLFLNIVKSNELNK